MAEPLVTESAQAARERRLYDAAADINVKRAADSKKPVAEPKAVEPKKGEKTAQATGATRVAQNIVGGIVDKTKESIGGSGKRIADALQPPTRDRNLGPLGILQGIYEHLTGQKQSSGEAHPMEDIGNLASGAGGLAFEATMIPMAARVVGSVISAANRDKDNKEADITPALRSAAKSAGADPDLVETLARVAVKGPGAAFGVLSDPGSVTDHTKRAALMEHMMSPMTFGEVAENAVTTAGVIRQMAKYSAPKDEGKGTNAPKPGTPEAKRAEAKAKAEGAIGKEKADVEPPKPDSRIDWNNPKATAEYAKQSEARQAWEQRQTSKRNKPPVQQKPAEEAPAATISPEDQINQHLGGDYALISAKQKGMTPEEQAAAHATLGEDIKAAGYEPVDQVGHYGGEEPSYLVPGMTPDVAMELAKKNKQESVGTKRGLEYTDGSGMNARNGEPVLGGNPTDYYSEANGVKYQIPHDMENKTPIPVDSGSAPIPGESAAETMAASKVEPTSTAKPGVGVSLTDDGGAAFAAENERLGAEARAQTAANRGQAVEAPPVEPVEPAADPSQVDPTAGTEGAIMAPPEETQPVKVDPYSDTEAAGAGGEPLPPKPAQTITDLHEMAKPAVEQSMAEGVQRDAELKAIRARSGEIAQELRAQGASRKEINDAVRAFLNEKGIKSKNQEAADAVQKQADAEAEAAKPPQVEPKDVDDKSLAAEIKKLKKQIKDITDQLGGEAGIAQLNAKFDTAIINQFANVGAAIYAKGAKSLKAFSAEMIKEFGPLDDALLKNAYVGAQDVLKNLQGDHPFLSMLTPKGAYDAFKRGKENALWYDKAPEELIARHGEKNLKRNADAYAATSNGTDAASTNIDLAEKAIKMMDAPEGSPDYRNGSSAPFTDKDGVTAGARTNSILFNLNQVARGDELTAPKIGPYGDTLGLMPGEPQPNTVVDRHMATGFFPHVFEGVDGNLTPKITKPQRAYVDKVVRDIATKEGMLPQQVQAAMWDTFKRNSEVRETTTWAKEHGWSDERLDAKLKELDDKHVTHPFDVLVQRRTLGPTIMAAVKGDMSPTAAADLVTRLTTSGALRDRGNPVSGIVANLMSKAGLGYDAAKSIAQKVVDTYQKSGLSDQEGALKWDFTGSEKPYDREAAQPELERRVDELQLKDALGLNLADRKKGLNDQDLAKASGARDRAFDHLKGVMDKIDAEEEIQPGELHHAVTVAGAVADKVRSAQARFGPESAPGALVGGEAPVTTKKLLDFGENLSHGMTEPQMYSHLATMEGPQQSAWLADMYRMSSQANASLGAKVKDMWMTLYMNVKLSNPYTLGKATASHFSMLPASLMDRSFAAVWGKFLPGEIKMVDGRAVPAHVEFGETTQMALAYWDEMKGQLGMLARRDWEGVTQQMITEGEYHPPIAMPNSLGASMVNAVAGAPSFALGAQRAPFKVIARLGTLRAEAWRQGMADYKMGLTDDFAKQVEFYQRNPTVDMMNTAADYANEYTFTKNLDGAILGGAQKLTQGVVGKVLVTPFARVSLDIVDQAVQHMPVLGALSKAWREDFQAGGPRRDIAMGKMTTGLMLLGTGLVGALAGTHTGYGPSDPTQRALWEAAGWRPNQVYNPVTGKPMFSHEGLGFLHHYLAATGDAAFILQHAGDPESSSVVMALAVALGAPMLHSGYIDAMSSFTNALHEGMNTEAMLKYLRDKIEDAALAKPGIAQFLTGLTDPGEKPSKKLEEGQWYDREWAAMKDDVTAAWPGWNASMPAVRNFLTGKRTPRDGFLPWYTEVETNENAIELKRLEGPMGKNTSDYRVVAPPAFIGGKPPIDGIPLTDVTSNTAVRLDAWQYDRLIQLSTETKRNGQTLDEAMTAMRESSEYKAATEGREGMKALLLQRVYHGYVYAAQKELIGEDRHLAWQLEKAKDDKANKLKPGSAQVPPEPPKTEYPRPGQRSN